MRKHFVPSTLHRQLMSAVAVTTVLATQAWGQDDGKEREQKYALEEVVVTAQKRSESQQSVGVTLSAFSGDVMKELNVDDIADVAANIPNVQVNYGFGPTNFNVRGLGVNEFSSNLDSPIAVHVDESYISKSFTTSLLLFDIGRVEALKGPQGTLFGRNATGGAVNFFTNKPHNEFEASINAGFDTYETLRVEGVYNTPLTDSLSLRLSGFVINQGQGFYENTTRNEDEGKTDKWAVRGQLNWAGENTEVNLSLSYGQDRSDFIPYEGVGVATPESVAAGAPEFCPEYLNGTARGNTANCVRTIDGLNPGDDDPFTSEGDVEHQVNNESFIGQLRIDHDFSIGTFSSISTYQTFERDQREDADGTPGPGIENFYYDKVEVFGQELRLASDNAGVWNYVAGLYYLKDDFRQSEYLRVAGGAVPGLFSSFTQSNEAVAAFLHNNFQLTDSFSLTGGIRWSREEVTIVGGTDAGLGSIDFGDGEDGPETIVATLATHTLLPDGGERTDENVNFKVGFEWEPELEAFDQFLFFGNVSTGFRSGGYNATFVSAQEGFTSLEPETITAYEAGFKTTFLDNRARVNVSGFIYDFSNGIVNVDTPFAVLPVAVNAASIDTKGIEIDGQFLLAPGLELNVAGGWLDSEIVSDITAAGVSLNGFTPVNAPEWTFNGQLRYEFEVSDDWNMIVSTDWSWRDDQFLETVNAPSNLEDAYWIGNARITLTDVTEKYSVSIYGSNITNTTYRTYANDLPSFGWLLNIYGPPRVFGVSAGVRF
ncbi:TonB-dependent receptor [Kordiimonas laminariae]|uniref:TonB-dependent receptor n=1 Tax=Kordiimonas laminariae TaxID=2917717 RepID=UPI001FF57545|nr:TonB-dependent receptor [Kordiimonas laminariae]MCK0070613.1 TonB-dependent receptor [Kordiimonas laminariae]